MSAFSFTSSLACVVPRWSDADKRLRELATAFMERTGNTPTPADIEADAEWGALHRSRKEEERAAAELTRRPGSCSVYIARRRRYCSHAAADGLGGLCSEHAAAAAARPEQQAQRPEDDDGPPPASGRGSDGGCPSAAPAETDPNWAKPGWALKRNLRRRMKRMTNPLSAQFAAQVPAPDWAAVFADPSLPSFLDIGCAKGKFLLELSADAAFAERFGAHNFCGVEIFAPLAAAANAEAARLGRRNVHYVGANANLHFSAVCPPNLARVAVQFPDPWKEDNAAKRVMTPAFAEQIAAALRPGGEVGERVVCSVC